MLVKRKILFFTWYHFGVNKLTRMNVNAHFGLDFNSIKILSKRLLNVPHERRHRQEEVQGHHVWKIGDARVESLVQEACSFD